MKKTISRNRPGLTVSSILIMMLFFFPTKFFAQPPGGPYGPVDLNYKIPETNGIIYFTAPDGNAKNSGTKIKKPTSLQAAMGNARTGDVIILRGGIYRTGNLRFNQGIVLQAYADEKPVLKGTYIADHWEHAGEGLWKTQWQHLFPGTYEDWWTRERNEKYTPLHRFNDDMVFIDGRFLQSANNAGEVDTNTFFIDYEKKEVYIGVNPTDRLVEITAFNVAIHRTYKEYKGIPSDSIGPVIRGISFTQYADTAILVEGTYPEGPMDEAEYGNDVIGTLIENCEISYCSRIGAYLMGDSLTIRNCKVSNTSTEGIYLVGVCDALLERNMISSNNIEHLTGYFPAAVKIFNQSHRVTCRNNWITDLPHSNGVWYDVGNRNGVFINNWVENVGRASENNYSVFRYVSGFFFEISKGAICAGNVFLNCDNGSFVLNSSNVELYQNTYINSKVVFGRTERNATNDHFGWHPATGPDVDQRFGHVFMNNLVVRNNEIYAPLLEVWQSPPLCSQLNTLQLKELDHNVYIKQVATRDSITILWSEHVKDTCIFRFDSPAELHDLHPEFEGHSMYLENLSTDIFRDVLHHDYQPEAGFPVTKAAGKLPEPVRLLLGQDPDQGNYVGAYPPAGDQ